MIFHIVTIFPEFFQGPFSCGILGRAINSGLVEIRIHDLRDWTSDAHRTVDGRPFGGDEGMVMKIEPIDSALSDILPQREDRAARTVLLSAQGRLFDQAAAERLAGLDEIVLICGRYEGVDERVAEYLADEELAVGSYVLSGGEWAAGMVVDSVARLCPGVVGNEASTKRESFAPQSSGGVGILDCPQYTRPARYESPYSAGGPWEVPGVLLSGHHAEIARWRRKAALEKTRANRPDLLGGVSRSGVEAGAENG